MKAVAIGSLSALLGLATAHVVAQEPAWRRSSAAPAFERAAPKSEVGVTLSRPVPLAGAPNAGRVIPAHFAEQPPPLFRAKVTDPDEIHHLMPVGPTPVQPGTVKASSQPQPPSESGPAPRSVVPFLVPAPQQAPTPHFIHSNPTITDCNGPPVSSGPAPIGSTILGDCGVCDTGSPIAAKGWGHGWLHQSLGCCEDSCCLPRPKVWLRGEYLLWQLRRQDVPAMISNDPTGVGDADGRALPFTSVIYGDEEFQRDNKIRSGVRFAFGFWFPHHCDWGMDASFFTLLQGSSRFDAGSPGVVSRLFFDDENQQESYQVVSGPYTDPNGQDLNANGTTTVQNVTRLWGADVNLRKKLWCGPRFWLDGQIGYRYLQLTDALDFFEDIYPDVDNRPFQRILVHDGFRTRNQFNGFQLGLEGELRLFHRWFIAGNLKVAVGNIRQQVDINGSTTFLNTDDGAGQNIPRVDGVGGLYALVTNIGKHERDRFAVLPEFGIKLGYDITDHLRVYAGYNFMYLNNVVRAGDQVDRRVNPNFVPDFANPRPVRDPFNAPLTPAVLFRQSDFWAQGGQFGVEYHW